MANDQNQQQNKNRQAKQEKPVSQLGNVVLIGFIGGLFWSALGQLSHYFNFTEIAPMIVLSSWKANSWTDGYLGIIISILICGLAGIAAAFLYYWILRKQDKLFVCIIFGALLWLLVHLVLVPVFPTMPTIREMDFNTIVTTLCLYILFGVFVGVSVSFDESERQRQKELDQQQSENVQS